MILVIFEAGASYDSLPSVEPNPNWIHSEFRPPLAKDLFDDRAIFAKGLADFPDCYPIAPYLQAAQKLGHTIEYELEKLERESETDPERKIQMAAIRYYLHMVIWECEREWNDVTRGITSYVTFLDQLRRMRQNEEPVCLVTFNYDRMIESALRSVFRVTIDNISQYIAHDAFKLFKLHGSVDWAREIDTPEIEVGDRNTWDVARELIRKADQLTISGRYRMVAERPIGAADGLVLYPALAIPVETKREYEWPIEHLDCLQGYLPKITKVLTVGWRGAEQNFLHLLGESLSDVSLCAVAENQTAAENVVESFDQVGVRGGRAAKVGFSEFVVRREAEEFLRG